MPRLAFWKNLTSLQRRAIVLVGVSLFVGFFLSRRETIRVNTANSWQTFAVSGVHPFHVDFPVYPRHDVIDTSVSSLGMTVRTGIFTSEDREGGIYTLRVTSYPEAVIQKSRDVIMRAEGDALFPDLHGLTLDVAPSGDGVVFTAHRYDGGPSTSGRVIVDGTTVYTFVLSGKPSPTFDERFSRFVASFTPFQQ